MQLYHTQDITILHNQLDIHDTRITHQLKRVMRSRTGDQITIQTNAHDHSVRYLAKINSLSDKHIQCTIQNTSTHPYKQDTKHLIVAMSNKRDKIELIVQKASECGITHISIIPMTRSIIRQANTHKLNRINAIALEAMEQSWSVQLPIIGWCDDWDNLTYSGQILLANMGGESLVDINCAGDICLIVGPEGGIDNRDLQALSTKQLNITTISLGSTVLRMETAAIIGSWLINQ